MFPSLTNSIPPHAIHNTLLLFPQRNPHPEPGNHLDKDERKKDAILKGVAAPGGWLVGRVVAAAREVRCAAE